MTFRSRTYSLTTNTCMILGVGSAFGFDRTGHLAWLVLGGCAATSAIAIYFVQHWQAKLDAEWSSPVSMLGNSWVSDLSMNQTKSHLGPIRIASIDLSPRSLYGKTQDLGPVDYWSLADHHAVLEAHDSAELVSRIVRELQEPGKRRTCELVIDQDLSATLRFKDDDEQPWTSPSRLSQPTTILFPETAH